MTKRKKVVPAKRKERVTKADIAFQPTARNAIINYMSRAAHFEPDKQILLEAANKGQVRLSVPGSTKMEHLHLTADLTTGEE